MVIKELMRIVFCADDSMQSVSTKAYCNPIYDHSTMEDECAGKTNRSAASAGTQKGLRRIGALKPVENAPPVLQKKNTSKVKCSDRVESICFGLKFFCSEELLTLLVILRSPLDLLLIHHSRR